VSDAASAIVVGAGVLGAALTRQLVLDGWEVTLVDQHPPGTTLGSSGGVSRLIRTAHGPARDEARAAWESLARWRAIEAELGTPLVTEVGLAWLVGEDDAWQRAGEAVLRELGVPVQTVALGDAGSLFPDLATDDLRYLLYEPRASLVAARRALIALVADARARGARFVGARAERDGDGVLAGGERLTADRVIWAAGCWTATIFGELLQATIAQQDTYYYGAAAPWNSPPVPAWSDLRAGITGAGNLAGDGVKVGLHEDGPVVDLDGARRADPALRAHAGAYLARRFPSLVDAPLVHTEVQHTAYVRWREGVAATASVGGVRLTRDPAHPSVWILGDGSGSWFKTAPVAAAEAAERLRGA
jgi:sarcosine oxidase